MKLLIFNKKCTYHKICNLYNKKECIRQINNENCNATLDNINI